MIAPEQVRRIAVCLRADGWSYAQIGAVFGYHKESARRWCDRDAAAKHRQHNIEYTQMNLDKFASYRRKYYRVNKAAVRLSRLRKLARDSGYAAPDISAEALAELLENCDGVCALCRKQFDESLHLDHNHETGEVRGFLCNPCNLMVGNFERAENAGVPEYLGREVGISFPFPSIGDVT